MNEDANIEILIEEDKWECHACGKMGKGFKQIWLAHLCQHFISLCPKCEIKFKQAIANKGEIMSNLLTGLMDEIKRNEELLKLYEAIPTGKIGAIFLRDKIQRAKDSIESGDVVEMVKSLDDLKKSE